MTVLLKCSLLSTEQEFYCSTPCRDWIKWQRDRRFLKWNTPPGQRMYFMDITLITCLQSWHHNPCAQHRTRWAHIPTCTPLLRLLLLFLPFFFMLQWTGQRKKLKNLCQLRAVRVRAHSLFIQGLAAAVPHLKLFLSVSKLPSQVQHDGGTMKRGLQLGNEQKGVTDFGPLWWGKWTIKCNFKLNRCFMCNTILILFPQAAAEELHAVHLCVWAYVCECVSQTVWEEHKGEF